MEAAEWTAALLTGRLALAIGTIAVAGLGYALLTGRADARRAIAIVAGVAIVTSARSIATVLVGSTEAYTAPQAVAGGRPADDHRPTPAPQSPAFDPYAGAAVPSASNGDNDLFRSN